MPLPRDRASLERLAVETEQVVARTMIALDRRTAQKHANELFRLGEIRARLDDKQEAERLFDQAATAFLKLPPPIDRDWAAAARIRQATLVAADARFDDALGIIERLVEQFRGFPGLAELPEARIAGIALWLILLEEAGNDERLYEAAGVALDVLNPEGAPKERLEIARAFAKRARAARVLGRTDEAAELFEQAIARYKAEDPAVVGKELIHTTANLTEMQSELGLVKESFSAFGQMIETTATTAPKLAMNRLFGSRKKRQ